VKKINHKKKQFLKALDSIICPHAVNLDYVHKTQAKEIKLGEQLLTYYNSKVTQKITLGASRGERQENFQMHFSYSDIDTIESARNGIKFNNFKSIYDLMKLPNSKWAEIIGISERTIQSILKDKKDLDQNKSEKLLSFLTLIEYALDVLESKQNVEEWLYYKSPVLQGKAPIEYVDTFQGISMLREHLFKIDTGNLV